MFLPVSGICHGDLRMRVRQGVSFWGFFTFNTAIYSYIGQLFMCLVRGQGTAQILASIFIGINNFFSGLIVRPQQMSEFHFYLFSRLRPLSRVPCNSTLSSRFV